jgi:DNA repair protein RecN (Recombination protein N)
LRDRLAARRDALIDLTRKATELEQEIAYIRSKEDFIRFEIQEIEHLNLKENEDTEIDREIRLLQHAEKIIEAGRQATDAIYDSDEAAVKLISDAQASLHRIAAYSDEIASLAESLEQAGVIVKEVAENLRDQLSSIDLDSSRLESLRERRAIIERLKRKYGETVSDVLNHFRRLKSGLDNREDLEYELAELAGEKKREEGELARMAIDLSAKRKTAAGRFGKLVETELRSLGIEGGGFKVVFEDVEEGEHIVGRDGKELTVGEKGIDGVEFFVRTNPGEDMLPLRRIASGGEISRVMLALKKMLADVDEVDSLVFDEIDSGIGGSIADVIAAKLSEVARSRQVICITHLAQIAAPAELHMAVGKESAGGRTVTNVLRVEGDRRVKEIARMIGGKRPPKSAKLHAEQILKRSVTE